MDKDTAVKFEYLGFKAYQGKKGTYNIVELNTGRLVSGDTVSCIKQEFVEYFDRLPSQTANNRDTKYVLDLKNVDVMDVSGLSALLVFNRLSHNNGNGAVTLINCNANIERLLTISQLDAVLKVKKDKSSL